MSGAGLCVSTSRMEDSERRIGEARSKKTKHQIITVKHLSS